MFDRDNIIKSSEVTKGRKHFYFNLKGLIVQVSQDNNKLRTLIIFSDPKQWPSAAGDIPFISDSYWNNIKFNERGKLIDTVLNDVNHFFYSRKKEIVKLIFDK